MTVGVNYTQVGERNKGIKLLEEAVNTLELLTKQFPESGLFHHLCGGALNNLAALLKEEGGDLDRAEELLLRAIEHQSTAMGKTPKNPEVRQFATNHHIALGQLMMQRGRPKEAVSAYADALEIAEALLVDLPQSAAVAEKIEYIKRLKKEAEAKQAADDSSSSKGD